jgi:glycosyltransferase involved in cell wall biosynthesis
MKPDITVVMPAYNVESFISESIQSILRQTYKNFKLVVIDDASTDRTLEIVQSFSDSRIQIVAHKINKGLINILNEVYSTIKTPFLARMDADDYCDSKRLELQLEFMKENTEVGICGTHYTFFGARSETIYMPLNNDDILLKLLEGCPVLHGSMMIRLSSLSQIKFNTNYTYAEDYGMFCESFPDLKLANINKVLYYYRVETHNTSIIHRKKQLESHEKARNVFLNTLGVQLNELESVVFHRVAEGQYLLSLQELNVYEKISIRIIRCNHTKRLFNVDLLEKKLKYWFFWSTFYSSRYGMGIYNFYKRSYLYRNFSLKLGLELWLRCLLKIKR